MECKRGICAVIKKEVCCFECEIRQGCIDRCTAACIVRKASRTSLTSLEYHIEELLKKLETLAEQKAALEAEEKTARAQLMKYMEKYMVPEYETPALKVVYCNAYVRTTVDTKKLAAAFPDVYDACIRQSNIKPHIKIEVKKDARD